MNEHLSSIIRIIESDHPLSEAEKKQVQDAVKECDRQEQLAKFKLDRAVEDRRLMAIMLEQSIDDLEKKSEAVEQQKKALEREKGKSDALLLNILPEDIAGELKQFGKSYARQHDEVSILFSDIKGFSSIAENLTADQLVTQLDECFRAFDNIVEKHGLEKIKTVGDAYIGACGLPRPVDGHAARTVSAALDMLDFLKGFNISKSIQNLPTFEFRFGIHTGPVVTGVVGLKKFTYDIWGDAVNMAARMEQHGETGRINISGDTYKLVKHKFKCHHRGKVAAKNKGDVDMYFVEGIL